MQRVIWVMTPKTQTSAIKLTKDNHISIKNKKNCFIEYKYFTYVPYNAICQN